MEIISWFKKSPSDNKTYAQGLTEHDVARRLCELNVPLYIDDVERANDLLIGRLSDLCKLLTQQFESDNAKLLLVGSGEIYTRFYKKNPSLDERLLQVSLGAFKSKNDSWKFLTKGFERLRLRHPGNSGFAVQRVSLPGCIEAIWEAADGLPKSLNRLGQEIALKGKERKGVSNWDILSESNRMIEEHWKEYGREFSEVVRFLEKTSLATKILGCFYQEGIARIHQFTTITKHISQAATKADPPYSMQEVDDTINKLVELDFFVRTGKSGEIIFTKQLVAAHTLGVVMRNPSRFSHLSQFPDPAHVAYGFPVQQEQVSSSPDGEPSYDA